MSIIDITLTDQLKSFMDARHYDPNEIDMLALDPNTNGETTWYVDGTNGNDSYDGLYPDNSLGGSHGPFLTFERAINPAYPHRFGERILIRTGIYEIPFGTAIQMNLLGTQDDDHYFIIGPYGDGEVVFDWSDTSLVNSFSLMNSDIYKATFIDSASIFNPNHLIMDWDMRKGRKANGRYGNDNSGVDNKTTSMTDTRRNFTINPCLYSNVSMNAVGAYIYNVSDKSWGVVTSVSTTTNTNDTLNFSGGLTGGTTNKFNDNDPYVLIHFDVDGNYLYIDHKKVFIDNSGINNKYYYTVDTTQDFSGYENGWIQNSDAGGPITSITTTTNANDTINFSKGLSGVYYDQYINNGKGTLQSQVLHAYKKVLGSDLVGTATGNYQFNTNSITDTDQDFSGYEGAVVINETTGAFSRVVSVETKTNPNDSIVCYNFYGGTVNYTTSGDNYRLYKLEDIYNHLLVKSETGNPNDRNIKISKSDPSGSAGFRIFNEYIKFYGITFICSRSIGLFFLSKNNRVEKCRIMWCGKHAVQGGYIVDGYSQCNKLFIYQNVMNNWPRGSTYGANGGWPQAIQLNGDECYYNGLIIYDNGGEGVGSSDILENCIVVNNYSQNIYFEKSDITVRNNVVGLFRYDLSDWLTEFYYQDSYNFFSRNTQKMHTGGITMGAEISGVGLQVHDVRIYNNIIIGCFEGISQYFEFQPNGLTNSFIANNTIILISDYADALFEPYAGIKIIPSTVDANSFIKNNIIIGSVLGLLWEDAQRVNLFRVRDNGITTSNIICDNNLYSYPGATTPFTLSNGSGMNPRNFTQWKAFTGWDASTQLTDTPGLVGTSIEWLTIGNIRKKHLKLLSSSVARDMGDALPSYFTTDFDGNTRSLDSGAWDIGAITYSVDTENYTKESVSSLGTDDTNLANDFIPVEYDYLNSIDDRFAQVTSTNQYGVFLLKTTSLVGYEPLSIKWSGKTNIPGSSSTIYLQIYNRTTASWETLATNTDVASDTLFTMIASVGDNLENYYDSSNTVACRIYQQATAV